MNLLGISRVPKSFHQENCQGIKCRFETNVSNLSNILMQGVDGSLCLRRITRREDRTERAREKTKRYVLFM